MAGSASTITGGASSTATTTATFATQTAGTVLALVVASDDYRATTGATRPESTGWTLQASGQDFLGFYVWTKIATGAETTVQYTIGSGVSSAYAILAITGVDTSGALLDNTPTALHTHGGASTTSSTATTTAGARFAIAFLGAMHSGTQITGASGWTNAYTEVADQIGPATGSREIVAAAVLSLTGGGSTSSNAAWSGTSSLCSYGATLVFKEATGGTGYTGTASAAATAAVVAAGLVQKITDAAVAAAATVAATGSVAATAGSTIAATATITATGAVTTGSTGTGAVNATSTVTAAGVVGKTTGTAVTGTATVAAAGTVARSTSAAITATVTVAATGSVTSPGVGTAVVTATATIAATGTVARTSNTQLTATATITAAGIALDPSSLRNITATATLPDRRWQATTPDRRWKATT